MNQSRFLAAFLLLLSIFLVGCSDDSGTPGPIVDPNITQTIGANGGTFVYQNGNVRLVVPGGALTTNTDVSVRQATGFPADNRLLGGTAWTVSTAGGVNFNSPVSLRIRYANLPLGADPNSLEIFRLTGGTWTQIESTVDTTNNTVSANITQPGTYAIFITGGIGNPDAFRSVLGSAQEVPAIVGDGGAEATVSIADDEQSVIVNINSTRNITLSEVVAAHIHRGRIGESGPVVATLYTTAANGPFSDPYTKVVTTADLNTTQIADMAALLQLIRSNHAYINVHTTTHPGGFVRGQLGPSVRMFADLTGGNVVPPVTTTANGNATVTFSQNMTSFEVVVNTTGIGANAVNGANIRLGGSAENGPILFNLTPVSTWNNTMTFTLTEADFVVNGGINSFAEAVGAILGGRTYLQIATTTNPTGELRGQIRPPGPGE